MENISCIKFKTCWCHIVSGPLVGRSVGHSVAQSVGGRTLSALNHRSVNILNDELNNEPNEPFSRTAIYLAPLGKGKSGRASQQIPERVGLHQGHWVDTTTTN